ncbi:hypothetical protein N658DRAFT_285467 [Parathielavia hyrcaniae]|uniref:Uncharacterized protein n=1 Tax=Parathielavia hyrcaniae TaxID=113614 RepID=A0AAN6Q531_9PEZI|nr:hypothetical protein N658DRAFT_285467 [Parathielavia hyrcaniae]
MCVPRPPSSSSVTSPCRGLVSEDAATNAIGSRGAKCPRPLPVLSLTWRVVHRMGGMTTRGHNVGKNNPINGPNSQNPIHIQQLELINHSSTTLPKASFPNCRRVHSPLTRHARILASHQLHSRVLESTTNWRQDTVCAAQTVPLLKCPVTCRWSLSHQSASTSRARRLRLARGGYMQPAPRA